LAIIFTGVVRVIDVVQVYCIVRVNGDIAVRRVVSIVGVVGVVRVEGC
jgi:hypothetical protein